ncbi:hypothetical protein EC844_103110 [Acinetobacter calcoaceticus]|uniref:Uncharacterized protein n=1 Tax=Acinetobacter calcoaceticus TaxID=471 RepID=A0A4R1Y2T0_ACICA|nr:hypothetical protein EC844_103110 [Acinetobacter calcoaceticus]
MNMIQPNKTLIFPASKFILTMGISLLSASLLLACKGGGDGDKLTAPKQAPVVKTDPNSKLTDIAIGSPVVGGAALPPLPIDTHPTKIESDDDAINALINGVYTTGLTTVEPFYAGRSECAADSSQLCPFVTRYQMDKDKRIITKTWAYLFNSQKWVEIQSRVNSFDQIFFAATIAGDGQRWTNSALPLSQNLAERQTLLDPKTQKYWPSLRYTLGNTEVSLIGRSVALKSVNQGIMSGVSYSTQAQTLRYHLGVTKGELINLNTVGMWQKADDAQTYPSLDAFRAKHSDPNAILCFTADRVDKGIVFNRNRSGADLYQIKSNCDASQATQGPVEQLREGLKTIDQQKVMYLTVDPRSTLLNQLTSELQFYWVFALNSKGQPMQGRAYQQGFMQQVNAEFYNEAAVKEWLKAKHHYYELALPWTQPK